MKKESALKRKFKMVVESKLLKKKILLAKKGDLPLLEQIEEVTEAIPPPDPFQDLRYDEALASRKGPRLQVWNPVVSVLVKRHLAYQPPVDVAKPFTLGLQLAVDEKQQPLELYEPVSRFTRSVVETLKQDKVQQPRCQNAILRKELAKQEHALHAWEDSLKSVNRRTAWISKKIGRPTAELLMTTPLHLPPPEKHRGTSYGSEHDFPKVKQQESFYHSDAFSWMPRRVGPAAFSIDTSPTWTEREFYKPPLTIASPRLDDTLPTSLRHEKRYQDQERARAPLQKIVVKGAGFRCPSSVAQCSPDDNCGNREDSKKKPFPHVASSDSVHSKACLMVEDNMYYWGEPCPQDLMEVGFVCQAGERAYNQIRLANLGKTVIRCVWCKTVKSNHYNKGHYRFDHFVFDYSDRILLPRDRVTLKVQFHADYPGFWREVWHLKTEPALGPDGSSPIPISLWARALVSDDYDIRRRELERQLDVLVAERIVPDFRDQLLRNLPHRDYDIILRERFPVTEDIFVVDDVELFEQANPGLSYHGHAMFTILKLYKKVQELRHPSTEVDLVGNTGNFVVEKCPIIPLKTERSFEERKTSEVISSKTTRRSAYNGSGGYNVEDAKRNKLSKKTSLKKKVIVFQMPSRTNDVSRRTEVDALLESNSADQEPLERRNISVKGLYNMLGSLDERLEEKNSLLMELNQAVSDMSFNRGQPNVHNFKHLVCRTALCQAADDVAAIAQRLWHDLRVDLRTESFGGVNGVKMLTAVHCTNKGGNPDMPNTKADVRQRLQSPPKRTIVKAKLTSKSNVPRHSDQPGKSLNDVTEDTIPLISAAVITVSHEMYSKLLFVLVYERVERLLLDLLPLMTQDEPQMDPLKPRPEPEL